MEAEIRVLQFGCGPIGCSIVRCALERPEFRFVGAIDIDKNLLNRDLGEIVGANRKLGVVVSDDADGVLSRTKPDLVFHNTRSSFREVYPQIEKCINAGANVVSTCEELSFPFRKEPELSRKLDELAKKMRVTVLSTGVNPGFLMDAWPLFMSGVCQQVTRIKAVRVQNASSRRGPFQKKIGAGCTLAEFRRLVDEGALRHVGLSESIAMIAAGLGWEVDEITETIEPLVATKRMKTDFVSIEPGLVAGVRQVARGLRAGKELIAMEFEASVEASESYDSVYITGIPNMEVTIKGGVHGDIATAAIVVNAARRVLYAPSGLLTMLDMPIVTARGSRM